MKTPRIPLLKTLRVLALVATAGVLVVFATFGYNMGPRYYLLMLTAFAPATAYGLLRRAVTRAAAREEATIRWTARGQDVERVRYTRLSALQETYLSRTANPALGYVDDRTWADLNMDEVRERMDVAFTIAGRNQLLWNLRHSLPDPDGFARRRETIAGLRADGTHRNGVAGLLARVGEEPDADPASLLWNSDLNRDPLLPLFIALSAAAVLSILLTALVNAAVGGVSIGILFIVNMWVYYRRARHVSAGVPDLRVLSRMIEVAPDLGEMEHPEHRPLRGAFRALLTGAPGPTASLGGDIVEMLFLYIKIFFLVDLLAYERITAHIRHHREHYRNIYATVGTADAAFAMASFRERNEDLCDAEVLREPATRDADTPWLTVEDGFHPLVEDAVANSLVLRKPGAIVTGTNMAGKSTFLRTLGVNLILAQTAGFAFASRYSGRALRVMSSIDKSDDLAEGRSFYYDEADRIFRMIEEVDSEVPALLLIDELLSGTNSLERESASIAILDYLAGRNALIIAATHDVTIARTVADRYAVHFFTDHADENGLSFDYRLKDGIVETRNAIRLLRLIGYPEDVIRSALERTKDN